MVLGTECLWPSQMPVLKATPPVRWHGEVGHLGNDCPVWGSLLNGISALVKQTPESSLASSAMWEYNENVTTCSPEDGPHHTLIILTP